MFTGPGICRLHEYGRFACSVTLGDAFNRPVRLFPLSPQRRHLHASTDATLLLLTADLPVSPLPRERFIMNTQSHDPTPQPFEYEHELERYLVDHFDDVISPTGLNLLLVGHQPRFPGNRVDLLAVDQESAPWLIELKIGTGTPEAVTQLLRYSHAMRGVTANDLIALPNNIGQEGTLEERFETRFNERLSNASGRALGLVLIAKEYNASAAQVLAALHDHGAPLVVMRYIPDVSGNALQLESVDRQELARIAVTTDAPSTSTQAATTTTAGDATPEAAGYRVHIRDEVARFWDEFSETYERPVAPIALIMTKYRSWRDQATAGVLPKLPEEKENLGLLAREIKTLALKSEWVRLYYRQDCPVLAAANPRTPLEARLRRGYPYTRAAYARQDMLAQHVELVA